MIGFLRTNNAQRLMRGARLPCGWRVAALALAVGWYTPPVSAQSTGDVAVAFDDAGRLREITPGIADRLGLRPPAWPVQGEYKRARLLRTDAGAWILEVQRFDNSADRVPLTADQVGQVRLEVTARAGALARATGRPVEAPALATVAGTSSAERGPAPSTSVPPAAGAAPGLGADTPMPRGAFITRETVLGTALFAPAAWIAADSRAFSPSAALFTAAGSFLLATNAVNRAPFGRAQTNLGTLAALGGTAAGAGLAFAAGVTNRQAQAVAALAGGVGLHVLGLGWGRGAHGNEVVGTAFGALAGGLAAAGALGAGRVFESHTVGNDRWTAGALSVAALAGAPMGRAWSRTRAYAVTPGDMGATAWAGALGAALGYGAVGAGRAAPAARFAVPTLVGAGALVLGDRALAAPYDHDHADVGTLVAASAVGAAVAVLPYRLAGNPANGTAWVLGSVGAAVGLWGGEIVTRPRAGTRRTAQANTRPPRVVLEPSALLFAALRTPGIFPIMRATF